MNASRAAEIALDSLIWLAAEPEALGHFLAATGLSMEDLRARQSDPEFLGFVLDFVLMSDASVLGAAGAAGVTPDQILRARAALPGGDTPDWT